MSRYCKLERLLKNPAGMLEIWLMSCAVSGWVGRCVCV